MTRTYIGSDQSNWRNEAETARNKSTGAEFYRIGQSRCALAQL
jgi:hypothetical protein